MGCRTGYDGQRNNLSRRKGKGGEEEKGRAVGGLDEDGDGWEKEKDFGAGTKAAAREGQVLEGATGWDDQSGSVWMARAVVCRSP